MADINWLNDITLGKILTYEDKKAALMTPITFPGQNADKVEVIDTLGIAAYMNISGRWTGNFRDIQNYINRIKTIADGQQTSLSTFRSPFVNSEVSSSPRYGNISKNTSTSTNKLVDSNGNFVARGIQTGDYVKNLTTSGIAEVSNVAATELTLVVVDTAIPINLFPNTNTPYAVTANITVKVLSIDVNWELPGLSWCNYKLSLIQAA